MSLKGQKNSASKDDLASKDAMRKKRQRQSKKADSQLKESKRKDIIINSCQNILNQDTKYCVEAHQEIIKCLMRGWESYTITERAHVSNIFLDQQCEKVFMDWADGSSSTKPQEFNLLSGTEMCVIICRIVQNYPQWVEQRTMIVVTEFLTQLETVDELTTLFSVLNESIVQLLLYNLQYIIGKQKRLSFNLVRLFVEGNAMKTALPILIEKFPIHNGVVKKVQGEVQVAKGHSSKESTAVYYRCLSQKYPQLQPCMLAMAFKYPDALMHHNVLEEVNKHFEEIQKSLAKLYDTVIQAKNDHYLALRAIIQVIKRRPLLITYILKSCSDKNKIDVVLVASMAEKLVNLTDQVWQRVLSKGLDHAVNNVDEMLLQNSSAEFDNDAIQQWYKTIVARGQPANSFKDQIMKVFLGLQNRRGGKFVLNKYQVAVATQLVAQTSRGCCAVVASGDGKTFIMIGLANYHSDQGDQVIVAVSNDMLFEQIQDYIDIYCGTGQITVCLITNLTIQRAKDKVVICDEVDYMIEHQAVNYLVNESACITGGLINASYCKKCYLLTATLDTFHARFLKILLNTQEPAYHPSINQLVNSTNNREADVQKEFFRSMEEAQKALMRLIKEYSQDQPIIIFIEKDEKQLDNFLCKLCDQLYIDFRTVDDNVTAKQARLSLQSVARGIVRVTTIYSRGFDLKLTKDSVVIVIANSNTLREIEMKQMFGRGCRSQGRAKGVLLMVSENSNAQSLYQDILSRKEMTVSGSVNNLAHLVKAQANLSRDRMIATREAYENNKWKVPEDDFEQKYQQQILELTTAASLI